MQIGILEPDGFSEIARKRLCGLGPVFDHAGGAIAPFIADKEVLFVRLGHRIDAAFLAGAPRLQALCSPTTGHNHIDLEELAKRHIRLVSLQGESEFLQRIRATPEHTIGLILALLRNYRTAFLDERNDHWDRDRCRGEELFGMPIGIIGFGRVGQRVASYLRAFEAQVSCYDPHVTEVPDWVRRSQTVGDLIAENRVIVLCAGYVPARPVIVDRECVAALGGRYFVNIARGELLDEDALLTSVEKGLLAGCAVDVIRNETGQNDHARWIAVTKQRNVIVTPHIGGATFPSMAATEEFVTEKLLGMFAKDGAGVRRISS